MYNIMNQSNIAAQNNTVWWTQGGAKLNATITSSTTAYKKAMYEYDSKKAKYGSLKYIGETQVLYYFNQALDLQKQTSATTIGASGGSP